jgi:hypothetical protein
MSPLAAEVLVRLEEAQRALDAAGTVVAVNVANKVLPTVDALTASIAAISATITVLPSLSMYGMPARVTALLNSIQSQLDQEAANMDRVRANFGEQIGFKMQTLVSGQGDDAADSARLVVEDSQYMNSISGQVSAAVVAFGASEAVRFGSESASLTAAISDAANYASTTLASAVSQQVVSIEASQSTYAASVAFKLTSATGSTDFATWYACSSL